MNRNLKTTIESEITNFVESDPLNRFKEELEGNIFVSPLVGFAQGSDDIFELYKEVIGDFHLLPSQFLSKEAQLQATGLSFKPEDVSVISWILPISEETRKENRRMTDVVSKRWTITRMQGELFNNDLRRRVVDLLRGLGRFAAAPLLSEQFRQVNSGQPDCSSTWSERHAAYAAGLGTFGLCDGLITPRGKAMRCGSVVAGVRLEPSGRPYSHHYEYCLHHAGANCKKCAERCPVEAISAEGHDKVKCRQFIFENMGAYVKEHYEMEGYGCGLCQTKVPCEYRLPAPD